MKQIILFFILATVLLKTQAQQNLFNIPSGDITPHKKVFFQQQINVNGLNNYSSKSHFVYGLGKNWDVGINLVNMYFDFSQSKKFITSTPFNSKPPYPYYPLGLFTAQKKWNINKHFFVNVGTQAGANLARSIQNKRVTHFSYGLVGYQKHDKIKLLLGSYLTDWRFVGGGNNAGIIAGAEVHLNEKWLFMADFISGNHKNSVSVVGVTYNVKNGFQLCAGYQIPNENTFESPALVVEINLFNF